MSRVNRDIHYCKHCDADFEIKLHEFESGDFFLECPSCGWKHYRHFKNGIAVHCDIAKRKSDPVVLNKTNYFKGRNQ